MRFMLFLFFCSMVLNVQAQYVLGASMNDDRDYSEWTIYVDDFTQQDEDDEEPLEGKLTMRWASSNNIYEWDIRIGEYTGDITLVFNDNPNRWQMHYNGDLITAYTTWQNDFTVWRVSNGDVTVKYRSKWKNTLDEWLYEGSEDNYFIMNTEYENDPRSWLIEDACQDNVTIGMKLLMTFLAIHARLPK